jgi:Family of unknown function (DUF5519)
VFDFVVRYLGFLKHIPLLPHMFDAGLKISLIFGRWQILDYLDEIENEVLSWDNTSSHLHKYGGIQFDINKKEIGHIHGNGLLDILFSKEMKLKFVSAGRVKEHHIFKNSGWISFYIKTQDDKKFAIELLKLSYINKSNTIAQHSITQP